MKKYKFVVGKQNPELNNKVKSLNGVMYLEVIKIKSSKLVEGTGMLISLLKSEDSVPVTVMGVMDECECQMLDVKQRVTLGNRYADALVSGGFSSDEAMKDQEKLVAKLDEKLNHLQQLRDKYKELLELSGKNSAEKVEMEFEL